MMLKNLLLVLIIDMKFEMIDFNNFVVCNNEYDECTVLFSFQSMGIDSQTFSGSKLLM